jgi:hypothetical protein
MEEDNFNFDEFGSGGQGLQDANLTAFYDKLSDYYSSWIPLEDVHYRNTA